MEKHAVTFVGAGPGDPELITVKGQQALAEADRIVYTGSLVPEAVLCWARPEAETINSAGLDRAAIVAAMVETYEQGLKGVRLHTGDPSLYGAIQEQMVQLDQRHIPYTVIPGVTAAFAAAAAMKREYTLPGISQTLILTRLAGRTPVPEAEALESLAAHQASMAIYLSIGMAQPLQEILARSYGAERPCAIAFRVSQPDERIRTVPISSLAATVEAEDIRGQALVIVGGFLESDPGAGRSRLYDPGFSHQFRQAKEKMP
jgi:precorrin-4/cobalt-precorrin-4 C11-methyltransferase